MYTVETPLITLITQHFTERSPTSYNILHLALNFLMLSCYVHPGHFALVNMNCLLLCPCYTVLEVF